MQVIDSSYRLSDGTVAIRCLSEDDLEMHLAAVDEEQMDWLWDPGHREAWEALTPQQQREHQSRYLEKVQREFGPGPKWCFAVDVEEASYVAYVDCDLANPNVPRGQANISYAAHPSYRGRGYVSGGVRLAMRFLRENTSATEAHIVVDPRNTASIRVAHAVGASEVERFADIHGRVVFRHVVSL